MSVSLDEIMKDHFDSAEDFSNAMALFYRYCEAKKAAKSWGEFQETFLDRLDDETSNDSELLESAIAYKAAEAKAYGANVADVLVAGGGLVDMLKQALDETFATREAARSTSIPLTDAFNAFIESNRVNWKANGDSEMKFTIDTFPLLEELIGNISTGELTIQHTNLFKQAVLKMPSNRHKKVQYRELTISEIIKLDVPEVDQLKRSTKQKYLTRLGKFLTWLKANGYTHLDLSTPLQRAVKLGGNPRSQRNKYNDDDLKKLFNSDDYVHGLHDAAFKYWVPLIGLFTGARINEICQLLIADVYQETESKIWVFDINETEEITTKKSVKGAHHRRLVPIHRELIRLGILDYISQLKINGESRLFPELPYKGAKNKYANKAMRWFNNTYTNSRNCNIQTTDTSFHSIRHSVMDNLHKIGKINVNDWAELFGQLSGGSEGQRRYVKGYELPECQKCINKINFKRCLDMKSIKPWKLQTFGRRCLLK